MAKQGRWARLEGRGKGEGGERARWRSLKVEEGCGRVFVKGAADYWKLRDSGKYRAPITAAPLPRLTWKARVGSQSGKPE